MGRVLQVQDVEKYYGNKNNLTKALAGISFEVEGGEYVGVMGASGSGKTTLLNCISTIDAVTSGHIVIDGADVRNLKSNALAEFRRTKLGFIFQDFNLLDTFSIRDNIFLPLVLAGKDYDEMNAKLQPIAKKLESLIPAARVSRMMRTPTVSWRRESVLIVHPFPLSR